MKVIELKAENVKKLKAVEIKPDGNLVVIGGKNTAGKSSVLDSIYMVLSGKKAQGKLPVRIGEDKATIDCDLGKLTIHRTINENGNSTLKVTNDEGMVYQSPQSILDAMSSKLTFDPLAFSNETPKKQREILKGLVGLDFDNLNDERKRVYDERTSVNRDLSNKKAEISVIPEHQGVPDTELSVSDLTTELMEAQQFNKDQEEIANIRRETRDKIDDLKAQIKDLQAQINHYENGVLKTPKPKDKIDIEPIREKISNCEAINKKVRENQKYNELKSQILELSDTSKELTQRINGIDEEKAMKMSEADMPIEGLGFDENGVTYQGVPFDQCSSAEQLRVSVAMGVSLNPKLKILLIRDGSLLDDDNFGLIKDMADEYDVQIWVERVGEGKECSLIIEDGEVKA